MVIGSLKEMERTAQKIDSLGLDRLMNGERLRGLTIYRPVLTETITGEL